MAEENESLDDRTEEATPERRDEFRERGQVATSKDLTSVIVLASCVGFLTFYAPIFLKDLMTMYVDHLGRIKDFRITPQNFYVFSKSICQQVALLIAPLFLLAAACATAVTFMQTRLNFSIKRIKPDFDRINPLKGVVRMVSMQAWVELLKGMLKTTAIIGVTYLVLKSEWVNVPGLLHVDIKKSFRFWGTMTENLFWGVSMLLVCVAALDFGYNWFNLERKMKMTKKEVKEDYKRREVDPHVRARIRRMQRDFASKRMLEKTKEATVLVTNPEHFAVALKYELGMGAPLVVAKGMDFLALRMREIAKSLDIPIIENKPLARTLYKMVEPGQEIPESLYKAVSEVIRYVFKLKGVAINRGTSAKVG